MYKLLHLISESCQFSDLLKSFRLLFPTIEAFIISGNKACCICVTYVEANTMYILMPSS